MLQDCQKLQILVQPNFRRRGSQIWKHGILKLSKIFPLIQIFQKAIFPHPLPPPFFSILWIERIGTCSKLFHHHHQWGGLKLTSLNFVVDSQMLPWKYSLEIGISVCSKEKLPSFQWKNNLPFVQYTYYKLTEKKSRILDRYGQWNYLQNMGFFIPYVHSLLCSSLLPQEV